MGFFDSVKKVAKATTGGTFFGSGSGGGGAGAGGAASGNPWLAAGGMALDYFGQQSANKQNMELMEKQMRFQRHMSNTSYRRAVDDMIKAGLNPMLAYSQGGASTPSGSLANVESVTKNAVRTFREQQAVNSAVDYQRAQTAQSGTQANLNVATTANVAADTAKKNAETANILATNPAAQRALDKINSEINSINQGARLTAAKGDIISPWSVPTSALGKIFNSAADAWRRGFQLPSFKGTGQMYYPNKNSFGERIHGGK